MVGVPQTGTPFLCLKTIRMMPFFMKEYPQFNAMQKKNADN